MAEINGYSLSRIWFDWCFENPEKISPNHTALYFFCIEHCNRLGWKRKFGLPTTMAKEAIGIRSYNTYIKTLNELVSFGFISMIEKSKNQYSSNIVALSNFDKALDKALIKHTTKQGESNSSIVKQVNKETIEQKNIAESLEFYQTQLDNLETSTIREEIILQSKYKSYIKLVTGKSDAYPEIPKHYLNIEQQLSFAGFCKLKAKETKLNIDGLLSDKVNVLINGPDYCKNKKTIYMTINGYMNRDAK